MGTPQDKGKRRTITTVTYVCGHSVQFRGAPPQKGDICTCLQCYEEVVVVSLKRETMRVFKSPDTARGWETF
jgi:hypothetical protein